MNEQEDIPPMKPVHADDMREPSTHTNRERQWGGFSLGVGFLLTGVVPGIFAGWKHVNYIFAVGGLVIAIGNLIWIFWSRRQARHSDGSHMEWRPGDE